MSVASPSFLRPGNRFEIHRRIGSGSMGVVYLAYDRETDSEVALKTLAGAGPEDLYRLKSEFRVLADLAHPNLVELYELVVHGDSPFFTMEHVNGTDFLRAIDHAREGFLARITSAAVQLGRAVAAIHAAGRLHRDIKPSNVLVTPEGRVVVLDFGLAIAFGHDAPGHYARGLAGTMAYMAPEVLLGSTPTPEADWYSVGVLLHEAACGELPAPFPATPTASTLAGTLGAEWASVVSQLLDALPSRRLRGATALLRLGGETSAPRRTPRVGFVGRGHELRFLHAAFADTSHGEARAVHVVGPSGIGKTELVRRFVAATTSDAAPPDGTDRPAVILSGRCHPHEALPYKALDPLIDGLSRLLLDDARLARSCVVEDAGALLRLFPVLERVPDLRDAPAVQAEPIELRRRGFSALRALISRLALRRRLVLWIDDLQWTDVDSLLVLRELLRKPAPPVFVLVSYRSEDHAAAALLESAAFGDVDIPQSRLALGPLDDEDGAALVREFGDERAHTRMPQLLADANGNPFLIAELARALAEGRPSPQIGDVVAERLAGLSESARLLLEVVSVHGGPIERSVALQACALGERGRPIASSLEKRSLLRTSLASGVELEIYHDRIREAVLAVLPAERRRQQHAALADVLAATGAPDAEALYRHSLGADRHSEAGRWASVAADRAAASLAFERAAGLYGEAQRLGVPGTAGWVLQARRAEALANAGRALEAARAYQSASEQLARENAAGEKERRETVRLRERAATHFLQTGHLQEGLAVTREVLADVGIAYPASPSRALLSSVAQRARLAMRGLRYDLRTRALDERTKLRLDACWGAAISLTMVDPAGSDTLGMRHLLESLDAGDAFQITRSLGAEAGRAAQLAGKAMRRRCARLTDMMEELVHAHGGPFEHAHLHAARGMIAFQSSLWVTAHEHFAASSEILRRDCFGVSWELATIETFGLSALAHGGRFARLAEVLPAAIGDASDRGDIYASLLFHTGVLNQDWLARDHGDEALALAEEAMTRWPASQRFQVQHYVHLIATVNADLYRGDPWSAFARMERAWPKLRAAMFLLLESARVELRHLRARAALAAAAMPITAPRAAAPDPNWPRERLLRLAEKDAAKLARIEDVVSARPFAVMIRAGIAAIRRDEPGALALYGGAESMLRAVDMSLHAAAAGWRAARLLGGEAGAQRLAASLTWAEREGIRRPASMLAVFGPG